jgi:hypothetical protein
MCIQAVSSFVLQLQGEHTFVEKSPQEANILSAGYIYFFNEFVGSISQWKFITLKAQYTTVDYN